MGFDHEIERVYIIDFWSWVCGGERFTDHGFMGKMGFRPGSMDRMGF